MPSDVRMHIVIFVVLLAGVQSVATPHEHSVGTALHGRGLLQTKQQCSAAQIPGCTPAKRVVRSRQCVCLQCATAKGYVPAVRSRLKNKALLQCICPPGFYELGGACVECEVGAVCEGGNLAAKTAQDNRGVKSMCQQGWTTANKRAKSLKDCGVKSGAGGSSTNSSGQLSSSGSSGGPLIVMNGTDSSNGSSGNGPSTSNNSSSNSTAGDGGSSSSSNSTTGDGGSSSSSNSTAGDGVSSSGNSTGTSGGNVGASSSNITLDRAAICQGDSYAAPPTNLFQTCIRCPRGLMAPPDFTGLRVDKATVCQVPPGFYYNGVTSRECAQGQYRSGWIRIDDPNALSCVACPVGATTAEIQSADITDCKLCIDGWGMVPAEPGSYRAEVCAPCGYGEWSNSGYGDVSPVASGGAGTASADFVEAAAATAADASAPGAVAAAASAGRSGSRAGRVRKPAGLSDQKADRPGMGAAEAGPDMSLLSGNSGACRICPGSTFNHRVAPTFVSYGVTFYKMLNSPAGCVPRFNQLAEPAGARLGIQTEAAFTSIEDGVSMRVCVQSCPVDSCCVAEFESADGESGSSGICRKAVLPLLSRNKTDVPTLFYKLLPSVFNSGAKRKLHTAGSGIFSRCDMSSWGDLPGDGYIGMSPNPALQDAPATTVEWNTDACKDERTCIDSCLFTSPCWGFMYVPGKGYALRGGEDALGIRTFFAVPDPAKVITPFDMESLRW